MSLSTKAAALERKYRRELEPTEIDFVISISPCYDCDGCDKCASFRKEMEKPFKGRTIIVEGTEYDGEEE